LVLAAHLPRGAASHLAAALSPQEVGKVETVIMLVRWLAPMVAAAAAAALAEVPARLAAPQYLERRVLVVGLVLRLAVALEAAVVLARLARPELLALVVLVVPGLYRQFR
jgi:hypothetical protein